MDKNKNGSLSLSEFVVAFMDRDLLCTDANLTSLYKDFNKLINSGVTKNDIMRTLPSLNPKDDTFQNLNLTVDGKFELREFIRIMRYR